MVAKHISEATFLKRIKDTIRHYGMLSVGDKVIVAVSGGADSVCLLMSMLKIKRALGVDVAVANIDHGIRGKESEEDSEFVRKLATGLGLPFVHERVNIKRSVSTKYSIEERARMKRYDFLYRAAKDLGYGVIATGHTMDDQAETVLMRVICGSSSTGLTGIPPLRYAGDIRIIRPLIRISRMEIVRFLADNFAVYVEDSTNNDVRFLRNRIRHEILPFLEKYNPGLKRTLSNIADTLREDLASLERYKEKSPAPYIIGISGGVGIKLKDMMTQPVAVRKQIFKELLGKAGGNIKKLGYRHWMDLDYFLRASYSGRSLDLPGGIRVIRGKDAILFEKREEGADI